MSVSGVENTGGQGTLAQALAGNQGLSQEDFLKLLVTQLTNQDPLSPQDDKEFIAQMAQFSTVEGVKQMSGTMTQLQGASLLGRTVEASYLEDGASVPVTGVVTAASFKQDGIHLTVSDRDVRLDRVTLVQE